ncbi:hypothetical protein [Nitrosomonas marina]|uniref:Uncharacterized protein n=1 Tax=Nitrosomonas marina TaxID=917 RepID=A0A1H8BT86_9PROT|nr:hypothetical protein [Nitrosomonas marina]SEM85364.1 hypothetical protein SAMN05216325_10364 [Nitrosomonas marina]
MHFRYLQSFRLFTIKRLDRPRSFGPDYFARFIELVWEHDRTDEQEGGLRVDCNGEAWAKIKALNQNVSSAATGEPCDKTIVV